MNGISAVNDSLFGLARQCLECADPADKCSMTHEVAIRWLQGDLSLGEFETPAPIGSPGHPDQPVLVQPRDLPRRSLATVEGRAALIHSIAHIEFNAINLAWDAVYRFRDLPATYYTDWVMVAADEARHFGLLRYRLRQLGRDYGDFSGHNGLWDMARKTSDDVLARMAVVHRVLEARGLDVSPGMAQRLRKAGDESSAVILDVIMQDEIIHVEAGSRWFRYLCTQRGLEPEVVFIKLVDRYSRRPAKGVLHRTARRRAGFTDDEMDLLESQP